MHKRGQIPSQLLTFVLGLVVISIVIAVGYRMFFTTKTTIDDAQMIRFQTALINDLRVLGSDYGSIRKAQYAAPDGVSEVCLIDLAHSSEAMQSLFIRRYPLILDAIGSQTGSNAFFMGDGVFSHKSIPQIAFKSYPYMGCFGQEGGKFSLTLEGQGGGKTAILVQGTTTLPVTSQGGMLESADGGVFLRIAPGTQTSAPHISITMNEPTGQRSSSDVSETYRLAPAGATFSPPLTFGVRFPQSQTGCPPTFTYLYNGATLQSTSVDCTSSTAFFSISRFT